MFKNLRLSFLLIFIFGLSYHLSAVTVTIGSGTSTINYFPIHAWYGYSYTQQIYLQSEINTAGTITTVRFYKSTIGSVDNSSQWVIYMGHTTKTDFTSTTDWIPLTSLTEVFSGTVTFPNSGWMEITLTTPFDYNNSDNLVIAVDENQPNYNSTSVSWYAFSPGGNRGIYYRNDAVNPDPSSPPTASGTSSSINQIELEITPPANMTISSSTTLQVAGNYTFQGSTDQAVIALHVVTTGNLNPIVVDGVTFTTDGTTNAADLTAAKVYYTTSPTFSTANQFGSTINNPSGTLNFTGSQTLAIGNNYFWLAYDISPTAQIGNVVDGTCTQFTTTEPYNSIHGFR